MNPLHLGGLGEADLRLAEGGLLVHLALVLLVRADVVLRREALLRAAQAPPGIQRQGTGAHTYGVRIKPLTIYPSGQQHPDMLLPLSQPADPIINCIDI